MTAIDLSKVPNVAQTRSQLKQLVRGQELSRPEAEQLMLAILEGDLSDNLIASILTALEAKGPTGTELAGFAAVLASRMITIPNAPANAVDTCGTGGSGQATLNTSTLAGLIASAAGAIVAKHGNRSASGRCGSLDVLEALGANVELSPEQNSHILNTHGFAFLNARKHHPGLAKLGPIRKDLGFRTVFNLLGPILSPARVQHQLVGVSDERVAPSIASALAQLGHQKAWVVVGPDGVDEIGLTGTTRVWSVENGQVSVSDLNPSSLGLHTTIGDELKGGDTETNTRRFKAILSGEDKGPARDHVALNAAASLYIAGVSVSLQDGLDRSLNALKDGKAEALFTQWRNATHQVEDKHRS